MKKKPVRPEPEQLKRLAKKIDSFRFSDQTGIDNYFFEKLYDQYVLIQGQKFFDWVEKIFAKQTSKTRSYGDIDWSVDIIKNEENLKVLRVRDHVTCGNLDDYLVVLVTEKGFQTHLHIRQLWGKRSDYKKGVQHVSCPNLKFYEDRKFNMDYDEKLHMTSLGGVYGDSRDPGYIVTYKKERLYLPKPEIEVEDGNIGVYHSLRKVAFDLSNTASLVEEKE